jgi:hypothetical protein
MVSAAMIMATTSIPNVAHAEDELDRRQRSIEWIETL